MASKRDKLKLFMKHLADNGIERTPEEAKQIYKLGLQCLKIGRNMSQLDLFEAKEMMLGSDKFTEQEANDIFKLMSVVREMG